LTEYRLPDTFTVRHTTPHTYTGGGETARPCNTCHH